ncbi:hypothetical protein BGZ70_005810 [Mortierella alpina]|uniref:Uncharacterized protein n=1 Tax=Mortierella alpina TaxID=64518 RepID=A0A9P6IP87_MORAP|nr:hypothetical protein BGZ70_005810 [Mortierella alpina]
MVPNSAGDGSGSNGTGYLERQFYPHQEAQATSWTRTPDGRYKPPQEAFLAWVQDGSFNSDIDPAVPIINWLHQIMATNNLQWSTVLTKKSVVLSLFDNAEVITQAQCFKDITKAGGSTGIADTRHDDYDISRVLSHFRQGPSNMELTMPELAKKLCWLLGVCGFMRPDDIYCTDVARSGIVRDPEVRITPCIRYSKDLTKPLLSTTISVYMKTITRLMVPPGVRFPKLRALGSTLAALAGVPVADIMVQGHWSSPKIFEKHYRLSSATANNISLSTLGSL